MNGGWGKEMVKERVEMFVYGGAEGRFLVCFEKKGFCGQRRFEFGGKRGGFYRLWQKLNSDG